MFGNDILVAPVVAPVAADGKTLRQVWLPEGKWFDVCRNRLVNGNTTFSDHYALNEIPYFYKAGTVIVNNPPMMNLNERPDRLILKVVPGDDGETSLYEDDGDSEGYKQGLFTTTRIMHEGNSLTICPREGSFSGMPTQRAYSVEFLCVERPTSVTVNDQTIANGAWIYDEATRTVTVFVPATPCQQEITVNILY
jgi:alpha-glucosidase (family GH31 glycosyl hydrolase)